MNYAKLFAAALVAVALSGCDNTTSSSDIPSEPSSGSSVPAVEPSGDSQDSQDSRDSQDSVDPSSEPSSEPGSDSSDTPSESKPESTHDGQTPETAFTFGEAAEIMDILGDKVISDEQYYVKGVVDVSAKTTYGTYNLTSTFGENQTFMFYSAKIETAGDWSVDNAVAGKTVVGFGYLEKFYEKYEMPYLSAKYSPTGKAVTPSVWILD